MKLKMLPIDKPKMYINHCNYGEDGCGYLKCKHTVPHLKLYDCFMSSIYCKKCVEIENTNET
jgi:hypothetical protein